MTAKRYGEACESLKVLIQEPSQEPSFVIHSALGVCLQELKQPAEALKSLTRAAEIDPVQVENEPKFWKTMADLAETCGASHLQACGDYVSKQMSIALTRSNFSRAADLLQAAASKYILDGTSSSLDKACLLLSAELKRGWVDGTSPDTGAASVSPQAILGLLEQLFTAQTSQREAKESLAKAALGSGVGAAAGAGDSSELLPLLLLIITAATGATDTAGETGRVIVPLALCEAAQRILISLREAAVQAAPHSLTCWNDVKKACLKFLKCPILHAPEAGAVETAGVLGLEACLYLVLNMRHAEVVPSSSDMYTELQELLHAASSSARPCVLAHAVSAAQLLVRGQVLAAEAHVAVCEAHWRYMLSRGASSSLSLPRAALPLASATASASNAAGTSNTGSISEQSLSVSVLESSWMQDTAAVWVVVCSRCLIPSKDLAGEELLTASHEALQRVQALCTAGTSASASSVTDRSLVSASVCCALQWARLAAVGAGGVSTAAAGREAALLRPDLFKSVPGTTCITRAQSILTELSA